MGFDERSPVTLRPFIEEAQLFSLFSVQGQAEWMQILAIGSGMLVGLSLLVIVFGADVGIGRP